MGVKDLDRDFLSIQEFANLVDITAASLRHYDKTGVFAPAKRGAAFKNNYRYYSPSQITTVKMIRVLTGIGVPLKTIRELASRRSPEILIKLLSKHKDIVAGEIRFLQEAHAVINTFIELLSEAARVSEKELSVVEMPEKQIILGDLNDFGDDAGFTREFLRFYNTPREPELNMSFPVGGYFEDMAAFLGEPSQPTRFFSRDPKGRERKAAGLYLTGYTRGYYGRTNDLPERMEGYARKHGLAFNGPVYNIYLIDEISETNPENYLLQACASVTERVRDRHHNHRHLGHYHAAD